MNFTRKDWTDTSNSNRLDFGNYPLFVDSYYPEVELATINIRGNRKGNVRSLGNSAWEAVYACLGYATGYVSKQKYDEAGAMFAICKGANASITNWKGVPLDTTLFPVGTKGQAELLIGPTKETHAHLVELYRSTY